MKNVQEQRAALIKSIYDIRGDAVQLGFDFPTDPDFNSATLKELADFQFELLSYIWDNTGESK